MTNDTNVETVSPEIISTEIISQKLQQRMRHLSQVMENEDELPEMVRRAKETMAEPARG